MRKCSGHLPLRKTGMTFEYLLKFPKGCKETQLQETKIQQGSIEADLKKQLEGFNQKHNTET